MAWIRLIAPEDPEAREEPLARLYRAHRRPDGGVDNILRASSLNPGALEHHLSLYEHLMRGRSGISLAEREGIAVAVSAVNECHYWIEHHRRGLLRLTRDSELVEALVRDPEQAPLEPRLRAIVHYAVRLARTPSAVKEDDLGPLRDAGLSDADIHDVCAVTAYYCYVNRIASGLGIELET